MSHSIRVSKLAAHAIGCLDEPRRRELIEQVDQIASEPAQWLRRLASGGLPPGLWVHTFSSQETPGVMVSIFIEWALGENAPLTIVSVTDRLGDA